MTLLSRHGRTSSKEQHGGRASSQPRRVRAQIAGLPALENCSGEAGDAGEEPCDAAEDCGVDDPAQNVPREGEQRLDE